MKCVFFLWSQRSTSLELKGWAQFVALRRFLHKRGVDVLALARTLAEGRDDPIAVARRCFDWVRDEIKHSGDHRLDPVT